MMFQLGSYVPSCWEDREASIELWESNRVMRKLMEKQILFDFMLLKMIQQTVCTLVGILIKYFHILSEERKLDDVYETALL